MSDWKKEATTRRDIRRARDPNEVPKPGPSSKKDTKKWCRGKEGVPHKPVSRDYKDVKHAFRGHSLENSVMKGWKVLMCETCGKELDYYMPINIGGAVKPPPDWAK